MSLILSCNVILLKKHFIERSYVFFKRKNCPITLCVEQPQKDSILAGPFGGGHSRAAARQAPAGRPEHTGLFLPLPPAPTRTKKGNSQAAGSLWRAAASRVQRGGPEGRHHSAALSLGKTGWQRPGRQVLKSHADPIALAPELLGDTQKETLCGR